MYRDMPEFGHVPIHGQVCIRPCQPYPNLYYKVVNDAPVIFLLYVDELFLTGAKQGEFEK